MINVKSDPNCGKERNHFQALMTITEQLQGQRFAVDEMLSFTAQTQGKKWILLLWTNESDSAVFLSFW